MEIICPECQFSREVDETKIPARSQVATCPKCQTKFKFRELPDEDFAIEEPEPASPAEEKPAPTGPRQASLLDPEPAKPAKPSGPAQPEAPQATFPKLSAPGEDPGDELWDKLGGMAPPEKQKQPEPEPEPHPEPEPARPEPARPEPVADSRPADSRPVSEDAPEPVPGWTGEFNDDFPDPMQFEDEPEEEQGPSMQVPPPFEQLDRYGFFHGLFLTIKLLLVSPRLFFSVMPVGGGLAKPLTFTILVTMIQSFAQYIWGLAGLSSSGAPQEAAGGMSATMTALVMLLLLPAFITVAQFLLTAIYHLLLMLMRAGSRGFEGTFRALVYSNAPIVLGIFPMPFKELELGWMFIVAIWGLVLTIMGLKHIHKTSYAKVIPVCLIPLLLAMIAALSLYQGQFTTI